VHACPSDANKSQANVAAIKKVIIRFAMDLSDATAIHPGHPARSTA